MNSKRNSNEGAAESVEAPAPPPQPREECVEAALEKLRTLVYTRGALADLLRGIFDAGFVARSEAASQPAPAPPNIVELIREKLEAERTRITPSGASERAHAKNRATDLLEELLAEAALLQAKWNVRHIVAAEAAAEAPSQGLMEFRMREVQPAPAATDPPTAKCHHLSQHAVGDTVTWCNDCGLVTVVVVDGNPMSFERWRGIAGADSTETKPQEGK